MNRRLRNALVVPVMGLGSLALGNAGLLALPDTGGGGGEYRPPRQVLQLAALTPAVTPACKAPDAAKEWEERQFKEELEALGLAVD